MAKRRKKRKVTLGQLVTIALMFVLIGVTLGIGAYINSQIQTTAGWASTTDQYLAVQNATQGLSNIAQWLPIIGVVIAAGVIIGVLVESFRTRETGI